MIKPTLRMLSAFAVALALLASLAACKSECANPFEAPDDTTLPVDCAASAVCTR